MRFIDTVAYDSRGKKRIRSTVLRTFAQCCSGKDGSAIGRMADRLSALASNDRRFGVLRFPSAERRGSAGRLDGFLRDDRSLWPVRHAGIADPANAAKEYRRQSDAESRWSRCSSFNPRSGDRPRPRNGRSNAKSRSRRSGFSHRNLWCPGPESNRHALRRGILSPLRLPISPPGHAVFLNKGRTRRNVQIE